MACWSQKDKTVHARVVYYGPACAGKTSNLETLHRIADARRGHELLTVTTRQESTQFFDLLPFVIDGVLGYRLEIRLFTVPGLMRLDATRRVVLAGADAIIFVADSRPAQREKNIWSLQNLRMNMRNKQIDPERVPILYQINKRDVPDAAPAAEVAEWLGIHDAQVIPAVAKRGDGVLEALKHACCQFMRRAPAAEAGGPKHPFEPEALAEALDRSLAPHAERVLHDAGTPRAPRTPIVLAEAEPLEGAIETSVLLGEARTVDAARARRLTREADGFRRLGEALCEIGAGHDRRSIVESTLTIARDVLEARGVALVAESPAGPLVIEGVVGYDEDPLIGRAEGRSLLRRLLTADGPCVVDDLSDHERVTPEPAVDLRSLASTQLPGEPRRAIVAYAARPDGNFDQEDVSFLRSTARHLVAGLDKIRAHEDLTQHRDELAARAPTAQQPRARRSRRAVDRLRERFMSNLQNEMRAPLAAVGTAAEALREVRCSSAVRKRLAESVAGSVDLLQRQLDTLSRLIHVVDTAPLKLTAVRPQRLAHEAIRLSGHAHVETEVDASCDAAEIDLESMTRATANLIDNAVRFSPAGSPVCLKIADGRLARAGAPIDALQVSVLDRGPEVEEEDRQRRIGLYEAACQARRHGGALEYEPREGGGSQFRITVPLRPIAEEALTEVTRG